MALLLLPSQGMTYATRAHFSPGELDGAHGTNLRGAVAAYRTRIMKQARATDAGVADTLAKTDDAPILVAYTIVEADVAGPFVEIPQDLMDQAKLPALGYSSAIEALGEQFHASPKLLKRLNPGKSFTAGQEPDLRLQPGPLLGRQGGSGQGHTAGRPERTGGCGVDRPVEGVHGNPRNSLTGAGRKT